MKQNKKYALRKTAAYGLASCAVGLMLVGSVPTYAEEGDGVNVTSPVEDTQDTSRITDVLSGQVQVYIQASKPLTGNDFIVDADVAPDKLPAIEHYKTIFNQIPASYRRLVTSVQFIHAEDAILGDTSSSRAIKIRANYIHPDQTPDFSDGLATMFHELGHVIDFASIQGSGDSLWSISRDPYMRNLLEKTYPNNVKYVYESFANAFGSWLKYRVLGESDSNMQDLYNQFDSLFGDFIFNSPYNNDDNVPERTYKESTVFNWTGTFKSDKGEQLHDDAHLSAFYERVIHEANNSKTADQWTLVNRTSDHMEDLHLEDHRFFGYGEPNTQSFGGNVFTVPGRIGDYYLASCSGNKVQYIGQNLWYTWQDNIYNEIGKQGAETNHVSNFVYRQKDTKITLRLIDSEHPETVYHTVEVPAFTNYEHNGLDMHVFDSFKSEGELLDNLPNEVALENDGKTIDIRLKKNEEFTTTVKVKNEKGDVLKEVQVTGKHDSTNRIDYGDLSEINKKYDASKLPNTLRINKDQPVVEYVVSEKFYTVNWKVYDEYGYGSNLLHQGTVTGKYGEKLSDKLDLSQYKLDEFSKNRLNRYHFGIDSLTGSTSPQTVDYIFYAPDKVKKQNVFIQYVDDEGGMVYPTRMLRLEVGSQLRDYVDLDIKLDEMYLPREKHFNLGMFMYHYHYLTLVNEDDVLNYTVNDSGDQIVQVIYQREEASGSFKILDPLSNNVIEPIQYSGKADGKLSYDDIQRIKDALQHLPEDVSIHELSDAHRTFKEVDDFIDYITNSWRYATNEFNDLVVRVDKIYTKEYDIKQSSNLIRFFAPESINDMLNRYYGDVYKPYNKTDAEQYGIFVPVISGSSMADMYKMGKVGYFLAEGPYYDESTLNRIRDDEHIDLDVSSINTESLTTSAIMKVRYKVTTDGQLIVLDHEITTDNAKISEKHFNIPGYDTYVLNNVEDDFGIPRFDTVPSDIRNQYLNDNGFIDRNSRLNWVKDWFKARKLDNNFDYKISNHFGGVNKSYLADLLTTQYSTDGSDDTYKLKDKTQDEIDRLFTSEVSSKLYFSDMVHKLNPEYNDNDLTKILEHDWPYGVDSMDALFKQLFTGDNIFGLLSGDSKGDNFVLFTVPKLQTIKVKIVDESGNVLVEKDISALTKKTDHYDMTDSFKAFKDKYVTFDDLSGTWTAEAENNQDIIIHAKERFTKDTETKQVKRIIRYHDGKQFINQDEQVVTFTRTVTKDIATGELTYSDWASEHNQFDELKVAEKENRVSNIDTIPVKTATAEDKDEIIDVYYSPKISDGGTQTDTPEVKDSETQTKATIHVVYRNQDGTIYKEFDVQADKGSILDGSDLEILPDNMNFMDEFTTYEVKGDGTDTIERTVKKNTSDRETQTDKPDVKDDETQTKASIHVVYKNADGTIYKEFDVQADKGSILDGSDLEMLSDDMDFTDEFITYEVKGDGTDTIERTVKKQTSDSGTQTDSPFTSDGSTQTDTPDSKDNGTQTDNPDTSDGSTQTKAEIKVVYKNADGTVYKEFVVNADKGTILDVSDLEMLPDDMEFNDDFMFYEVKGDGNDAIERIVKKLTSDQGSQTDNTDTADGSTQTDNPDTSDGSTQTDTPDSKDNGTQTDDPDTADGSTQTKAEIKVVYKNADGTVYKEFVVNADKGTILDASDLDMLPDDMDFTDNFMFYEVKGDGHDVIERTVKKQTSDSGSQTDNSDTSDGSTQTDEPDKSDGSTQTDTPDSKDNGTQTDKLDVSDKGSQVDKPDVKNDATQTDRPKDEPTQSIPKQDGISEVKPLSNKAASGYTRVQPTKSVGRLSSTGQLPKAGSTDNSKLGLIGATMSMLGSILGFVVYRKKH